MELDRERGHRPLAFDKMEGLVREMQDPESGVPVRSQKLFLTSIPSAFMGYDLIEWLIERLKIEESEALSIANQLCQYGYFFPVSDSKNLVVKDDSSLYRFQSPYFWPWQLRTPDNVEYAIYLAKRTLRNKQRHGLEDYELESLNNLKKNLANKWDFITMQAEEQVRLAKDRKKGDKIVSDSQERAYWRVYRPPPGVISPLEQCPVPNRSRNGGGRPRKRTLEDLRREVDLLRNCLSRTRVKVSVALESMVQSVETFAEYDPLITGTQPSNPWVSEDLTFWQLNGSLVEVPTEKRVKRWALSMEELVSDPTGLQEFTNYLRKEYSHENIRFWLAVSDLRRSSQSQIQRKVCEIFEEFLAPGAPCEINIDGKTMERVHQELRNPSRFTFDSAAEHVYALLLKKDCYPRFIRSEHYKNLLATGIQPSHKKRFFGFVGPTKKKASTTVPPNPALLQQVATASSGNANAGSALSRRRGSDRSLSGSAHELAVSGVRDSSRVPHSHSQSNLSDIPYRETAGVPSSGSGVAVIEPTGSSDVCPWDSSDAESSGCRVKKPSISVVASTSEDVCPWEAGPPTTRKNSTQFDSGSSSSDLSAAIADASERLRRSCGISSDGDRRSQHTRKLSTASYIEPRRASVSAVSTSVRPSDITRPSVSSFDDFASARSFDSTSPDVRDSDDVIRRDIQTVTKTFKKSHSLKKTGSVASSSVAPIISVSSVMDDTIDDAGESEAESEMATVPPASVSEESSIDPSAETEKHPQEEPTIEEEKEEASDILAEEISIEIAIETNTPELSSSPQPECSSEIMLPNIGLAPLAEPDGASPISEWAPDSDLQSEIGPHIETGEQEETAIQSETKNNDVCPWEDEETCKVDAPFVKTYATLGYL